MATASRPVVNGRRFVLDTNVVSALRKPKKNPSVAAWAASVPATNLFLATPVIAEIGLGVAAKERSDPAQGAILRAWLEDKVLVAFANRILDFDLSAALVLANYEVPARAPFDDALIAAIAQANGMVVATNNEKHFKVYGVEYVNPFNPIVGIADTTKNRLDT